jgi:hypothetical protein
MRLFGLILLAVIVFTFLARLLNRRMPSRWARALAFSGDTITRLGVSLLFGWTTVQAVDEGGWFYALAGMTAVLTLWGVLFSGLLIWFALKYGLDSQEGIEETDS